MQKGTIDFTLLQWHNLAESSRRFDVDRIFEEARREWKRRQEI